MVGQAVRSAAEADKSGKLVIEAKNIGKSFGDRKIVDGFGGRIWVTSILDEGSTFNFTVKIQDEESDNAPIDH